MHKENKYLLKLMCSLKLISLDKLVMQIRMSYVLDVYGPLKSVCCKTRQLPCRHQRPQRRRSLRLALSEKLPPGPVTLPLPCVVYCSPLECGV